LFKEDIVHTFTYKMFSGIDFLLQRTMSSFFIAIKNLLTAYHIDKQSTGKIIEPLINTLKQLYRKVELFLLDHNNKVMLVK
ncbi:hypothetical protein, partial [Lactobacillus helveticus]